MRWRVVQNRRRDFEKNELKPHLQKQWCIGAMTSEYLARMENILHLHNLPYNEKRPVINFDELPVQLLSDCCAALPLEAGKPKRTDYEYERRGTACLLVAFEPLTGRRIVEVSERRTKADYCRLSAKSVNRREIGSVVKLGQLV